MVRCAATITPTLNVTKRVVTVRIKSVFAMMDIEVGVFFFPRGKLIRHLLRVLLQLQDREVGSLLCRLDHFHSLRLDGGLP